MKLIKVGKHDFSQVDDGDYEELSKIVWHIMLSGKIKYAARNITKVVEGKKVRKKQAMHNFLMGYKEGFVIDHKDRDGLNNQRNNLRRCTVKQNNQNRSASVNSTSKYIGVYRYYNKTVYKRKDGTVRISTYPKWASVIKNDGKQRRLGFFDNEVDAAIAYNEKAKELFGEFANLNVIE